MSGAVEAARRTLEEARRAVGAVGTEQMQAEREARRLRARAGGGRGLADLGEAATAHERRAERLAERAAELRAVADRAEVALERLRAPDAPDEPAAEPAPPAGAEDVGRDTPDVDGDDRP